jgi:hypothetical protein
METLKTIKEEHQDFTIKRASNKYQGITDSMIFGFISVVRYFSPLLPPTTRETYRRKICLDTYLNNHWSIFSPLFENMTLRKFSGLCLGEEYDNLTVGFLHYKNTKNVNETVNILKNGLSTDVHYVIFTDNYIIDFHKPNIRRARFSPFIIITEHNNSIVVCKNSKTEIWKAEIVLNILHTHTPSSSSS